MCNVAIRRRRRGVFMHEVCVCGRVGAWVVLGMLSAMLGSCGDDDGPGGADPCAPNPCDAPHETQCNVVDGQAVCSCDPGYVDDGQEGCVPDTCDPECGAGFHCENASCVENICDPVCGAGEVCVADGGSECRCGEGAGCTEPALCVEGQCVTPCEDGLDNDADGWTDDDDPDCAQGDAEVGLGQTACNDGTDNDGDGAIDSADEDCADGLDDDEAPPCVDVCLYGALRNGDSERCELWDDSSEQWVDIGDGSASMHDRARLYNMWLRRRLLAAGGVADSNFADTNYDTVVSYHGIGDSAIWTGTYLAAEALRALTTGSPDAEQNVNTLVETLHLWWDISGDTAYLARHAYRVGSNPAIDHSYDPAARRDHFDVLYDGELWNWKGHISRDQYQGVMLGFSLAYEATSDPAIRELIRQDVVELVEQLMEVQTVDVYVDSLGFHVPLEMRYCVFTDDETADGLPELDLDTNNYDNSEMYGFQEFHPNPAEMFSSIPGLSWLPDIPRAGSAIMLASFFKVALQVTENQADYAARRQAIADHYDAHIDGWIDKMEYWGDVQPSCGDSYYGNNIAFEPMYNLARLESDPDLAQRIRINVLRAKMWDYVGEHKNVWFAYIYAANQDPSSEVQDVVEAHNTQLAMFSPAPRVHVARDNSAAYSESTECPGNATEAIDVDTRCLSDFIWQRHPWKLVDGGNPLRLYPGVDYMAAYWLGRYHGFLTDDHPNTCLRWRTL